MRTLPKFIMLGCAAALALPAAAQDPGSGRADPREPAAEEAQPDAEDLWQDDFATRMALDVVAEPVILDEGEFVEPAPPSYALVMQWPAAAAEAHEPARR